MHNTRWFSFALIAVSFLGLGWQQQTPAPASPIKTDPYSIGFVSSAFDFFKNALKKGTFSSEVKKFTHNSPSLSELGDSVSIAVLKMYELDKLAEPENAEAYLTVVRNSFENINAVLEKSDREPRVTSLVLYYLEEKETSKPGIEKRIAYMKGCVKNFTCSSQGEADFLKNH